MNHESPAHGDDTPEAMLDQLRERREWDDHQREEYLGRIVQRFPGARVLAAVLPRLDDLGGPDAESLLRQIEANPNPAALDALANALGRQLELPPERLWEALSILDRSGRLEDHPPLLERWQDLVELLEGDHSLDELIEQIEGDPDGVWLALQGFNAIEPEIRAEIIEELAGASLGQGLTEFLRLLVYSPDALTRNAALAVLQAANEDGAELSAAWLDLSAHHPNEDVRSLATSHLAPRAPGALATVSRSFPEVTRPRLLRSMVTAVDGNGRASIVLAARSADGDRLVTAAFVCDVLKGLVDVVGEAARVDRDALAALDELADGMDRECMLDQHETALSLLAGCLWLGGGASPPSAQYWLEATAGPGLRPRPLLADWTDSSPESFPSAEIAERSRAVLDACPDWADQSPLTIEISNEIRLREETERSDPSRDSGAYRFLFERRLKGELERYRRMLFWMATLWQASRRLDLAASARIIAAQLSDPQHAVPGHPFTVALTTRSLDRAGSLHS